MRRQGGAGLLRLAAFIFAALAGFSTVFAAEHVIEIKAFKFVPAELTVRAGDTVKWINRDIAPHTATARDRSWDTKRLKKGEAMSIVVTKDMKMEYFCLYHPQMKARLVLENR